MNSSGTVAADAGMKNDSFVTVTDTPGETKLAMVILLKLLMYYLCPGALKSVKKPI
jgi:hypothetical protein